jgi:uncharacterized membrane protein YeaQ/YmgE (transglycosylase-associated protein family)
LQRLRTQLGSALVPGPFPAGTDGDTGTVLIVIAVLVAIVALFVIGWLVVGLVFKLLWWALGGVVIGALARLILPGKQRIGIIATAGAGIAAAFLGGVIGHIAGAGSLLQFVIALIVAIVIVGAVSTVETVRA